jgi:Fe-S-cluster containining protein
MTADSAPDGQSPHPRDLQIPDDLAYSCHNSGDCCQAFFEIPVDQASAERLRGLDLEKMPRLKGQLGSMEEAICTARDDSSSLSLKLHGNGRCVFLTPDRLCELHCTFGGEAKPQTCQDFPFRFLETPGGVYVGLSFVCPSVRGNRGKLLTDQRNELEAHYPRAHSCRKANDPIVLNSRVQLTWTQYLGIEAALHEILDLQEPSIAERLIGLNVLLNFIDTYVRQLHPEGGPAGSPITPSDKALADFLGVVRRSYYADIMRIARRDAGSPALQRMFLGMVVSFRNTLSRRRGRLSVLAGILGQYTRHAIGLGRVLLLPVTRPVSHRELAGVELPEGGESGELLLRYLHHALFRKDLLVTSSVTRGLNMLLLNMALIRWYAAALAAEQDRDQSSDDDFSTAISHCEKYYGFHSSFFQLFERYPAIDEIVESFMRRRNYPFVLLK